MSPCREFCSVCPRHFVLRAQKVSHLAKVEQEVFLPSTPPPLCVRMKILLFAMELSSQRYLSRIYRSVCRLQWVWEVVEGPRSLRILGSPNQPLWGPKFDSSKIEKSRKECYRQWKLATKLQPKMKEPKIFFTYDSEVLWLVSYVEINLFDFRSWDSREVEALFVADSSV